MTLRRGMLFAVPFLLACAAVFRRLNTEMPQHALILVGALLIAGASIYGYALAAFGNRWFDHGAPTVYQAMVSSKNVASGKGGTYYIVTLAPWGPVRHSHDIGVTRVDYEALRTGVSVVCMATYPGAFGLAWGAPVACDASTPAER
jgi:hypothetical protein